MWEDQPVRVGHSRWDEEELYYPTVGENTANKR